MELFNLLRTLYFQGHLWIVCAPFLPIAYVTAAITWHVWGAQVAKHDKADRLINQTIARKAGVPADQLSEFQGEQAEHSPEMPEKAPAACTFDPKHGGVGEV